jgi:hypothetical protein
MAATFKEAMERGQALQAAQDLRHDLAALATAVTEYSECLEGSRDLGQQDPVELRELNQKYGFMVQLAQNAVG